MEYLTPSMEYLIPMWNISYLPEIYNPLCGIFHTCVEHLTPSVVFDTSVVFLTPSVEYLIPPWRI